MFRTLVFSIVLATVFTPTASAQQWARKMFLKCNDKMSHDFGVVAKGAKAVYDFEFQNIFEEEVHIAGVRSSCGCTEPHLTKRTLKTFEKGAVRAVFNTKSFIGSRSATLTVMIDRPFYAEVQLSVRGYIRADVLFTPGSVSFGDVSFGQPAERSVRISYSGRSSWKIVDVRSANPHFEVELKDRQSSFGRVTYTMTVRIKGDAPVGYLQDQLSIVTNESYNGSLELPVDGRVKSPLTVSPSSLFLGILKPGDVAKKRLFVVGSKPFKITGVECPGDCFQFTVPEGSKKQHFLPLAFTAPAKPGKVSHTIVIKTDMGATATCVASATVSPPADEPAEANLSQGGSSQ